jgi:hypothetical protein
MAAAAGVKGTPPTFNEDYSTCTGSIGAQGGEVVYNTVSLKNVKVRNYDDVIQRTTTRQRGSPGRPSNKDPPAESYPCCLHKDFVVVPSSNEKELHEVAVRNIRSAMNAVYENHAASFSRYKWYVGVTGRDDNSAIDALCERVSGSRSHDDKLGVIGIVGCQWDKKSYADGGTCISILEVYMHKFVGVPMAAKGANTVGCKNALLYLAWRELDDFLLLKPGKTPVCISHDAFDEEVPVAKIGNVAAERVQTYLEVLNDSSDVLQSEMWFYGTLVVKKNKGAVADGAACMKELRTFAKKISKTEKKAVVIVGIAHAMSESALAFPPDFSVNVESVTKRKFTLCNSGLQGKTKNRTCVYVFFIMRTIEAPVPQQAGAAAGALSGEEDDETSGGDSDDDDEEE